MTKAQLVLAAMRGEVTGCVGCNRVNPPQWHYSWGSWHASLGQWGTVVTARICSQCLVRVKRAKKFISTTEAIDHVTCVLTGSRSMDELRHICGFYEDLNEAIHR